jgi:hypothetical protein
MAAIGASGDDAVMTSTESRRTPPRSAHVPVGPRKGALAAQWWVALHAAADGFGTVATIFIAISVYLLSGRGTFYSFSG